MTVSPRLLFVFLLVLCLSSWSATGGVLAASSRPTGLSLQVTPVVVDVGSAVQFTLRASKWPASARATVAFVSPHHGFSGKMTWAPSCSCFQVRVAVARRVHALEIAHAVAKVTIKGVASSASTSFQIRGLARNGRDFSPGGAVLLAGWVSDGEPVRHEAQHYCGWIRTLDGFGVGGYSVKFVVRFGRHTENLSAGVTDRHGVACIQKSIGFAQIGRRVLVDIYGAGRHASTAFTTRA